MAHISAVCVLHTLHPEPTNPDGTTAIDKRAVARPVAVGALGLVGDQQADAEHHGGADQAVYLSSTRIGQRLRVGASVVLEVTAPRTPCVTFARRMDEPHWVKRFTEHRAPGAYARVVEAGVISAGDEVVALVDPAHEVTVAALLPPVEPGVFEQLLAADHAGAVVLSGRVRQKALKAVGGR
jgi:MOSC domain-containing protein YiiM